MARIIAGVRQELADELSPYIEGPLPPAERHPDRFPLRLTEGDEWYRKRDSVNSLSRKKQERYEHLKRSAEELHHFDENAKYYGRPGCSLTGLFMSALHLGQFSMLANVNLEVVKRSSGGADLTNKLRQDKYAEAHRIANDSMCDLVCNRGLKPSEAADYIFDAMPHIDEKRRPNVETIAKWAREHKAKCGPR